MYRVKNLRTRKYIKDGITGKTKYYTDRETAERQAKAFERGSILDATAWNNIRPSKYAVEEIIPSYDDVLESYSDAVDNRRRAGSPY
jgi:predicted DNA-binding protein